MPRYRVEDGSLVEPADATDVIAVGAIDAVNLSLEEYSSRGPTNGPGGSLSGGRTKPDLAGHSLVSTSTYGTRALYGTGPAAMHVAGAAALVWSAYPGWSNAEVRSYLYSSAQDVGPSGKDNDYGYGRLRLGNPPSSCSYSLSPGSVNIGDGGGTGPFNVSTSTGCSWSASTSYSWIHITGGQSGSGNGSVYYSVDQNSGAARTGSITVEGMSFVIHQAEHQTCSYSISPTSQSFGANGGNGQVSVTTSGGCTWTASSPVGWVNIQSGSSGNGSGTVTYAVQANGSPSPRSTTLTIAGEAFSISQEGAHSGGDYNYHVAGIAHAPGAGGSLWRSNLAVANKAGTPVQVTLTYRTGGAALVRNVTLNGRQILEWSDVALSLFGRADSTAGSVEVETTGPVLVTARTYNESPDGTFGQYLPGASENDGLIPGGIGTLPQVKKTAGFRTNIGFVNLGSGSVTVRTRLYSATGGQLGSAVTTTVGAGMWAQENDIFDKAGVAECLLGYAEVQITAGDGPVWGYASVVDNLSNDPTTIPLFLE